jgi:hypothetical protein
MHVAAGLAAHRHELVHQRQDRIADDVGLLAHMIEVDALDFRFAGDDFGGFRRNHAHAGLRLGQCDFRIDVTLDQRTVGEQLPHLLRAERVAEQDGVDDRAGHGEGGS